MAEEAFEAEVASGAVEAFDALGAIVGVVASVAVVAFQLVVEKVHLGTHLLKMFLLEMLTQVVDEQGVLAEQDLEILVHLP